MPNICSLPMSLEKMEVKKSISDLMPGIALITHLRINNNLNNI